LAKYTNGEDLTGIKEHMTTKSSKNIDDKLLIALVIISLAIFSTVYYTSHREITDAHVLSSRVIDALEDTKSYRFTVYSKISMPVQERVVDVIKGEGFVDYGDKRLWTMLTVSNRSVETVIIDDMAYVRESKGLWQKRELSDDSVSVWESAYDVLGQQRSILLNADNISMHKRDDGWILDVIPDKKIVLEELGKNGISAIEENELKAFAIKYWIEKDAYHIIRIENKVELEMNIEGLVMPIEFNSVVYLSDYNEEMKIEAPI
jgi:hypothetical protein